MASSHPVYSISLASSFSYEQARKKRQFLVTLRWVYCLGKKNNRINEINKTDQIVGSKKYTITKQKELEAFSVHDRRTGFIVFLLRNPHLLEGGKRRQDGSTDPDGVFSLGRRDDLDLHGRRRQGGDLLLHSVGDAGIHGRTTREDRVSVKIFTDVDVTLHDAVIGRLVDAAGFHSYIK